VRHDRAGELDRTGQVRGDHTVDVRVGQLFGRPQHPVAGVGDDDVDAAELDERGVDDLAQPPGVREVELADPEPLAVPGREIARSSRRSGLRRVAATRSPRSSSRSVSSRPKPLEVPVMNHVDVGRTPSYVDFAQPR
jgi:hypothetical protein